MSSVHSVRLVGLTSISAYKIHLKTPSKFSDIFNCSLQKPIDFICIFVFCIGPTLMYPPGFKTDPAMTLFCSLPRQFFLRYLTSASDVFSVAGPTTLDSVTSAGTDWLGSLVGDGCSDFLYHSFHLNHSTLRGNVRLLSVFKSPLFFFLFWCKNIKAVILLGWQIPPLRFCHQKQSLSSSQTPYFPKSFIQTEMRRVCAPARNRAPNYTRALVGYSPQPTAA